MNIAFYNAYTAMRAYQQSLDVVSNNLANVSTVGYKEVKSTFNDLLYSKLNQNGDHTMQQGHGVMLSSVDKKFTQGILETTNYDFDFALMGEGFFATQRDEEDVVFTRDGAFRLGEDNGVYYLTRMDGSYVLDEDLQRIEIAYDSATNAVDMTGVANQIGIFQFNNPFELEQAASNTYKQTQRSGEAIATGQTSTTKLIQGGLEASTASMTDNMVSMMESQRAFQVNARLLQTADEIEEMVNNLR